MTSENPLHIKKLKAQLDDEGYHMLINSTRFGDLADPSNPYFNFFLLVNAIDWFSQDVMKHLLDGEMSIDHVAYCLCRAIRHGADDTSIKSIFEQLMGMDEKRIGMKKEKHDYVLLSIRIMTDYIFKR